MKALAYLALASLPWAGAAQEQPDPTRNRCDSYKKEETFTILYRGAPVVWLPRTFRPSATFTPEARVACEEWADVGVEPKRIKIMQIESGTKGPFSYRVYYSDGSGVVRRAADGDRLGAENLWEFGCKVDPIDDSKSCHVKHGSLSIWYYGDDRWTVFIGDGSNYPNSEIAIRLDDTAAVKVTGLSYPEADSKKVVDSLKSASRVRTRYFKWPNGMGEADFSPEGFAVALDLMQWSYEGIKVTAEGAALAPEANGGATAPNPPGDETRDAATGPEASAPPAAESVAAAPKFEPVVRTLAQRWSYSGSVDRMTGRAIRWATIDSENTVSFQFPYQGPQHGKLGIGGQVGLPGTVYFEIGRGQLQCPAYGGCNISVRFDDQKPRTWRAVGSKDNSSTVLFLANGQTRFVKLFRAARVVRIQVPVYQEGSPVFEFHVSGFDPGRMMSGG